MVDAAKGRRRTNVAAPPSLKLLEGRGNGKDSGGREVKQTPGFVRLPPEPPDFLTGEALECWEKTVPELARLQLTKPIDAPALAGYCLAYQRLSTAQRAINESGQHSGLLAENSQGLVRSPYVAIVEAASKELRAWAQEFGLTPAAEVRVVQQEGGGGGDNPFSG